MLLDVVRDLPFEPFRIEHLVDHSRRYRLQLDPRFPVSVRLFSFADSANPLRFNWHERLELFVCASGGGRFRLGDLAVEFSVGDVVVVDNLKLHGLIDTRGPVRRGVVVSFLAELICPPGAYPCDAVYLLPFYSRPAATEPVLRKGDKHSAQVLGALGELVSCYFAGQPPDTAGQAGCKAHLIQALYGLARHFGAAGGAGPDFDGRRRESRQFGRLYEHLLENYAEPITVAQAAAILGMSEFRFMRFFKKATGMTFVKYLTQMRLAHAYRLLAGSGRSIAEIAAAVGFSDQSYFDRRFRQQFGETPRQARAAAGSS